MLAGQCLTVVELSDGTVQARHAGKLLPLTRFSKDDAEISQGAIVSNKLLAGALQFIKDKQAEKDVERARQAEDQTGQAPAGEANQDCRLDSDPDI